jgi:hypothetical protein
MPWGLFFKPIGAAAGAYDRLIGPGFATFGPAFGPFGKGFIGW